MGNGGITADCFKGHVGVIMLTKLCVGWHFSASECKVFFFFFLSTGKVKKACRS